MAGQILVINGTSGSGKSSTAELFAREADEPWLLYGIDHFLAGTFPSRWGHHGPNAHEGIEAVPVDPADPDGPLRWQFHAEARRAFAALHEWIAAASRAGCNIVFDHLLMSDPAITGDLARRLDGLPTLLVTLKPPAAVLEKRVAGREMTKKLPPELGEDAARKIVDRLNRLRPWFYEDVYANDLCDLELDSDALSPEQVVAAIRERLAQGPGDAFARLRDEYS